MSFHAKRFLKKLLSWSGLVFFGLAAVMLYFQLSKHPISEIKHALLAIPGKNLIYSCIACLFGYMALASYDFLALKYIHKKLASWKWMFVGFIGFSVSNNAGHAIVSGGAVRYRLYTRWRFRGSDIVKMVTFSGFTYLIGCLFLVIAGYFLIPKAVFEADFKSAFTMHVITLCCAVSFFIYFGLALFYKKPFHIKGLSFKMPSFKMACAQTALGAIDSILASLVLYYALIPFADIPFLTYVGVFVVAQVLGVFSQVPGGLGVFEGLFLLALPGDFNEAHLFGALIAYRVIYYLLPLIISGILLFSYENYLRIRRKRIHADLS